MYDKWVIDATLYHSDDFLCFVPIENIGTDKETLVFSMNFISDIEHFNQGEVIGIIHLDGQEAVDKFCDEHPEILEELKKRGKANAQH